MDIDSIFQPLVGRSVVRVEEKRGESIAIHFTGGPVLVVRRHGIGVRADLADSTTGRSRSKKSGSYPTKRQREYLEFIKAYMARYGVSPAESDIQRHFMVSAPSVNQMVRTLEGRGFIKRGRDFTGAALPRSIRVLI